MKINYLCITMKSFPRIILIIMFVFTSIFMQECSRCICGDDTTFKILGFKFSKIWKISNNKMEYLNTNAIAMQTNDTIWINLLDSSERIAYIKPIYKSELLACCDGGGFEYYFNNWDSLNIKTIDNFDNTHPAGSSINDICILSPIIYYKTNSMFYNIVYFSELKYMADFNYEFSIGLLAKPTNNAIRIQFCFYNTKTNDSTMSISPILRFQ